MSKQNEQIGIPQTPEHPAVVKKTTGKDAGTDELRPQELEDRIAPARLL